MAKESSSVSSNTTSPLPSPDAYIGSFISVTSKSEIRYEGVLYYLNPQDCTLGLKQVRSYGTEGRIKGGQQVPPSDKVYEYILFRGSDIKDLQVKSGPPVQEEESIYNDPAIIQPNYHAPASSSSRSVSATSGSMTEFNSYTEPSALNARSHPSVLPSHHSGNQSGIWGSSQSMHSAAPSYGMPAGPTQWQGYNEALGSNAGVQQHSLSSATAMYPMQNLASTSMAARNVSNDASSGHLVPTSSSTFLNATPTLTSEKLSTPFTDLYSSTPSLPSNHPTLINSNGLAMPFPLTYHNASSMDNQFVNRAPPDPVSSRPIQPLQYSTSYVSDPMLNPIATQQQALLTQNLSQPKLSEHSPAKNLNTDPNYIGAVSSESLNITSSASSPAAQPPLLPLPPPSEKLQDSSQFTEEFDFQAMNEKFNKDEVWGYLGKANQRDEVERVQENGTNTEGFGDDNLALLSESEPKPAYNKDDFFDTISCNSINNRGGRNGQNRFSERMKLDSETFGTFQRRTQFGYGGHRAGQGERRGQYGWGRQYNYGNRGRGAYNQRWHRDIS